MGVQGFFHMGFSQLCGNFSVTFQGGFWLEDHSHVFTSVFVSLLYTHTHIIMCILTFLVWSLCIQITECRFYYTYNVQDIIICQSQYLRLYFQCWNHMLYTSLTELLGVGFCSVVCWTNALLVMHTFMSGDSANGYEFLWTGHFLLDYIFLS